MLREAMIASYLEQYHRLLPAISVARDLYAWASSGKNLPREFLVSRWMLGDACTEFFSSLQREILQPLGKSLDLSGTTQTLVTPTWWKAAETTLRVTEKNKNQNSLISSAIAKIRQQMIEVGKLHGFIF